MVGVGDAVVLVAYLNDDGEPMEWVLPDLPEPEVELLGAFLREEDPDGDVRVSAVLVESRADLLLGREDEL